MKKPLKLLCILLATVLMIPLAACDSTKDAYIYFELPNTPQTLDPQTASTDAELMIVKNIHEGLLRKDKDGKIICGIAESYEKSGLTYTFKLRKNAKWSDGEKITAKDFEFAFLRALSPDTKAPFAERLFCIKGASEYNSGATSSLSGVKAVDDTTLKITLNYDDEKFKETLTTAICMPCNQKFFEESKGKYGIFADNILSSGSYVLTRWRKDPFGIRLYRNDEYTGFAESENAAVFITCDPEEPAIEKLEKNSIDIAFIDSALTEKARSLELETLEFNNICWFLTLGKDFTPEMRKALNMLVGGQVYSASLPVGYSAATSLFPNALTEDTVATGMTAYDTTAGKELYLQELEKLEDNKFPADVVLYYYDDSYIKNVVTDIVGHWQSNLSAFVNIEAVSSVDLLAPQLTDQSYKMALFPVKAYSDDIAEYLKNFGITYEGDGLNTVQSELLKENKIIPIMFQNTVIAYSRALGEISAELGDGYIDFAFIIKTEE